MKYEKLVSKSEKRFKKPKPGDYWHEMFTPYFVVLAVKPLIVCDKTMERGDGWYWDLSKAKEVSREWFEKRLTYSSPVMDGKLVAHVSTKSKTVVEDWKSNFDSEYHHRAACPECGSQLTST